MRGSKAETVQSEYVEKWRGEYHQRERAVVSGRRAEGSKGSLPADKSRKRNQRRRIYSRQNEDSIKRRRNAWCFKGRRRVYQAKPSLVGVVLYWRKGRTRGLDRARRWMQFLLRGGRGGILAWSSALAAFSLSKSAHFNTQISRASLIQFIFKLPHSYNSSTGRPQRTKINWHECVEESVLVRHNIYVS